MIIIHNNISKSKHKINLGFYNPFKGVDEQLTTVLERLEEQNILDGLDYPALPYFKKAKVISGESLELWIPTPSGKVHSVPIENMYRDWTAEQLVVNISRSVLELYNIISLQVEEVIYLSNLRLAYILQGPTSLTYQLQLGNLDDLLEW